MRVNRVAEQPGFPHSVGEVPEPAPDSIRGRWGTKQSNSRGMPETPSSLQANVIPASQRHLRKQTSSPQANVIPANAGIQGCGEAGQQTRAAQRNYSHPN